MKYRALTASGDYSFGRTFAQQFLENSPAAVGQAVMTSLKLFQGEWFLDTKVGMPWASEVLGKNTQPFYDQAIKDGILNVQGVTELVSYSSFLNSATRSLVVTCTIDTIYGVAEITGIFGPRTEGFGLLNSTFILNQSILG